MSPHSQARKRPSSPCPPHPFTFPGPAECLEIDGNKKTEQHASLSHGSLCEAFQSPRYENSRTYHTWTSRWRVTGEGPSEQQESWVVNHCRGTGVAASPRTEGGEARVLGRPTEGACGRRETRDQNGSRAAGRSLVSRSFILSHLAPDIKQVAQTFLRLT